MRWNLSRTLASGSTPACGTARRIRGRRSSGSSARCVSVFQEHSTAITRDLFLLPQWSRISGGRPFVIKGVQCAADALQAYEVGCQGIVVTNHAGRQVDGAVGSLEVLPEIVEAVGDSTLWFLVRTCVITDLYGRDDDPVRLRHPHGCGRVQGDCARRACRNGRSAVCMGDVARRRRGLSACYQKSSGGEY